MNKNHRTNLHPYAHSDTQTLRHSDTHTHTHTHTHRERERQTDRQTDTHTHAHAHTRTRTPDHRPTVATLPVSPTSAPCTLARAEGPTFS